MTKEEILNGMSEEEFYNLYPTEEAYFMAKGGSLSGAPHNGQPTADEFFSYGAPALGHMNIPMSNPTYLAHGGTYFGGPIRPYQEGGDTRTVSQMWKELTGLPWSEAKKNGVTDGSYEANMQLRNALLKGSFNNLSSLNDAPRFRASAQEDQEDQEEAVNPIAAGRTAANIMASPTPQSLLVPKKSNNKVKATPVDKAITKTTKKAPPAKHIDAGAFQVVDNITGVTADYFKNSPLPGVVNTPNVNTPGPFLQKAKMEGVHMFPKTKAGTPSQLKKGPTDKRKIPQSGLVVDKRTNQAYYFGDKGEKGSFPVLTGANVDLNYNPYEVDYLENHPELRNTPTGYYLMGTAFKDDPSDREYKGQDRSIMPINAYGVPAPISENLAFHTTYSSNRNNPFDKEFLRREGLYGKADPKFRNTSFGCVNCQEENYNTIRNVFPGRDTALVLDSKKAADLALLQQAQARLKQKSYGGLSGDAYSTDVYREKKMNPAQWKQFNTQRGYNEITPGLTSSKNPNRYGEFYNPKEYQQDESGIFTKIGKPEGYDYNKDASYKPIVSYGYKDPVNVKPSKSFIQPTIDRKQIDSNSNYTTYQYPDPTAGYSKAQTKYFDNTTGQPIADISKAFDQQGKYVGSPQPVASITPSNPVPTVNKLGGTPYYGGDITEYCWGGLPGGANEMPRMDYGGYMDMGGYNSPTNYGSFSVPMNEGGILDASNNQDYPVMDEGGRSNLMKIIKAASKKMKKEYAAGGDITMQGGNQNKLDDMNNYFKSFIQQNASNAFVEEEEKSFRMGGIPMAKDGITWKDSKGNELDDTNYKYTLQSLREIYPGQSDDQLLTNVGFKKYSDKNTTSNNNSKQPYSYGDTPSIAGLFKQLAQDFGPQSRTQGYNNFPANFRSYWQANKTGRESINNLPENFQFGNLKVSPEYDALGRTWIGKKLGWGPKRINFELSGTSQYKNTPYKQGPQVQLADPNNPLLNPNAEQNPHVIRDPNREMNLGPVIQTKPNPGFNWNTTNAYGGLYKAQSGVGSPISMGQGVSLTGIAPRGTSLDSLSSLPVASSISTSSNVEQMKKQAGRETEQLYKTEIQGDTGTTNVSAKGAFEKDNSGLVDAFGQYAVPGIHKLAGMIEAPGQKRREQQAKLEAMTPGSDTGPFAVNTASDPNLGDYDQWGNFRSNSKVVKYGGMFEQGGFYEEGEEYDLSPEQMEYLRSQGYDFDILEDID
jgi:hypothetical protein